jgi:AcrR family transcriptional regulator
LTVCIAETSARQFPVITLGCYFYRMTDPRPASTADRHRGPIVEAAFKLLSEQGRDAVSTRSVSAAAGVQAPVIYRLFGDKNGLLDAVAAYGFALHLAEKKRLKPSDDPVEDLRAGWDLNVAFALDNPALYALIWGEPRPGAPMAAAQEGYKVLRDSVHRVAEAGRLCVSEDLAAQMLQAAGCGTALALLSLEPGQRDSMLSTANREAMIAAVTSSVPPAWDDTGSVGPARTALTLRAVLPRISVLTASESALLGEWLDRIAQTAGRRWQSGQPLPEEVPISS